jgi:hypothetical protein
MRNSLCVVALVLCLVLVSLPASAVRLSPHVEAQGPDPIVTWQVLVNEARLDEGLAPYDLSGQLSAAAQRHADDLAANGFIDPSDPHLGSDGTHEQQRAAEVGYAAWTWNGGQLIVDENVSTHGTIEEGMTWFLGHPPHRDNILSPRYREIGIGVAVDDDGHNYYVLNFGVRPNVLPIFINDGAASTDDPQVAIRLTNEEARPDGEGAAFMGRAIEVRISGKPDFGDSPWQPWEPLVPWTLPDTPGEHTVYVQFRDAAGRTAASADTIVLGEGTPVTPTLVSPSLTPEPTVTPVPPSPTPEPTATLIPTSPTPEPTDIPPPAPTTATPAPAAALTPEPTSVVEPTATTLPPSTPAPSAMSAPVDATPFPTWTPLPTPVFQETDESEPPLAALAALQGVVLILGIYLALRRRQEGQGAAPRGDRTV